MSRAIKILNPISGHGYTTRNRAKRFIANGRARWTDPLAQTEIEFLAQPAPVAGAHRPRLVVVTDAAPGRAVFPPWPGWDLRLLSSRRGWRSDQTRRRPRHDPA